MSHPKQPTPVEQDMIEEFGNIYEAYGIKRLHGLIVGLLLTQDQPVSLDDMVEMLSHSKGPISIAVRRLADIGLARKVNGPINRRNYYAAHPDIFYNNFRFNMATVRKNRSLAERFLNRIDAEDAPGSEETIKNLEHMHAFYQLMESFYQDFSKQWQQVKQQRLRRAAQNGSPSESQDATPHEATESPVSDG